MLAILKAVRNTIGTIDAQLCRIVSEMFDYCPHMVHMRHSKASSSRSDGSKFYVVALRSLLMG